ncbi:MAG TPA: biotin/lipoyl-containing protein [Gemmataceae bacterium]|nr:biotin/lipoyl-containing protein [Gemmataceae bacterium]
MKLRITIDGKVYEVEVEVAEPEPPQPGYVPPAAQTRVPAAKTVPASPVQPSSVPVTDESKVCRSPIAGVVVRVSAQVGQSIQVNDVLLVLEAMKMETVITSSLAGKIARVNVNVGDAVQGGQVLVEFE